MESKALEAGFGQITTCQYCGAAFQLPISFIQVHQHSRVCPALRKPTPSNKAPTVPSPTVKRTEIPVKHASIPVRSNATPSRMFDALLKPSEFLSPTPPPRKHEPLMKPLLSSFPISQPQKVEAIVHVLPVTPLQASAGNREVPTEHPHLLSPLHPPKMAEELGRVPPISTLVHPVRMTEFLMQSTPLLSPFLPQTVDQIVNIPTEKTHEPAIEMPESLVQSVTSQVDPPQTADPIVNVPSEISHVDPHEIPDSNVDVPLEITPEPTFEIPEVPVQFMPSHVDPHQIPDSIMNVPSEITPEPTFEMPEVSVKSIHVAYASLPPAKIEPTESVPLFQKISPPPKRTLRQRKSLPPPPPTAPPQQPTPSESAPKRRRTTFKQQPIKTEPVCVPLDLDTTCDISSVESVDSDETLPMRCTQRESRHRLILLKPSKGRSVKNGEKSAHEPQPTNQSKRRKLTVPPDSTKGTNVSRHKTIRKTPKKEPKTAKPRTPKKEPKTAKPRVVPANESDDLPEDVEEELLVDDLKDPEYNPVKKMNGTLEDVCPLSSTSSSEVDEDDLVEESEISGLEFSSEDDEFLKGNYQLKYALNRGLKNGVEVSPRQRRSGRLAETVVKRSPNADNGCSPVVNTALVLPQVNDENVQNTPKRIRKKRKTKDIVVTPKISRVPPAVDRPFIVNLLQNMLNSHHRWGVKKNPPLLQRTIRERLANEWFNLVRPRPALTAKNDQTDDPTSCHVPNCSLSNSSISVHLPPTFWRELSPSEAVRYLPLQTESVFLSTNRSTKSFLPLEASSDEICDEVTAAFYCGGSVLDMSWFPMDEIPRTSSERDTNSTHHDVVSNPCVCVSASRYPGMELSTLPNKKTDVVSPFSAIQIWCFPRDNTMKKPHCQISLCHDMGPCLQLRWHPHPVTSPYFTHIFQSSQYALLLLCPLFSAPRIVSVPVEWLHYNAKCTFPQSYYIPPKAGLHLNFNHFRPTQFNLEEFEGKEMSRFGVIRCIDWNWQLPHLIAAGTSEGYVAVWDLHGMKPHSTNKNKSTLTPLQRVCQGRGKTGQPLSISSCSFQRLNHLISSPVQSVSFKPMENGRFLLVSLGEGQVYIWDRLKVQTISAFSATQPMGGLFSGTSCPARADTFLSVRIPFSGDQSTVACYGHNWSLEHARYNWLHVPGLLTAADFSDMENTLVVGTEVGTVSVYMYPPDITPARYKKKTFAPADNLFNLHLQQKCSLSATNNQSSFNTYEDMRQSFYIQVKDRATKNSKPTHDGRLHPICQISKVKFHPNPSLSNYLCVGTISGFIFVANAAFHTRANK